MKNNAKKILIYTRYILPLIALIVTLIMFFVPTHRFRAESKWGEQVSAFKLMSNSWEKSRVILFGGGENTGADLLFSRTLFSLIIVFVILFVFSVVVSAWSLFTAMKYFISDNRDSAEDTKRIFNVFFPNRIVLCICSAVGIAAGLMPYVVNYLYTTVYSDDSFMMVLEAPDSLIVGGALVVASIVLSAVCAPLERGFDADIFKKKEITTAEDELDDVFDEDSYTATNAAQNEKIRRLFADKEKDEKDSSKKDE